MSNRIREIPVRLRAKESVEIEPGIIMPAGTYSGISKQLGVYLMNGLNWTTPEYRIEFQAAQLADMGMQNTANLISCEFDVTKFIRTKQIEVL